MDRQTATMVTVIVLGALAAGAVVAVNVDLQAALVLLPIIFGVLAPVVKMASDLSKKMDSLHEKANEMPATVKETVKEAAAETAFDTRQAVKEAVQGIMHTEMAAARAAKPKPKAR